MGGVAEFADISLEGYGGQEKNKEGTYYSAMMGGSGMPSFGTMQDDSGAGGRGTTGFGNVQRQSDDLLPPCNFQSDCHQPNTAISDEEFPFETDFSSIIKTWRSKMNGSTQTFLGTPTGKVSIENSAITLKRGADVLENHLSCDGNSSKKMLKKICQAREMKKNNYPKSALQSNSTSRQNVPYYPSFPKSIGDSWTDILNSDYQEADKNKILKKFHHKDLRLLVQKELTNSDIGRVGRIVLPKKEAELNLPALNERDSMTLYMKDLTLEVTWKFKYRFWPNNSSRMYLLETTGDFVKAHQLQKGDLFIIYQNTTSGRYIVEGKNVKQHQQVVEVFDYNLINRRTVNGDGRYTQQPKNGNEGDVKSQLPFEQSLGLGDIADLSNILNGSNSTGNEISNVKEEEDSFEIPFSIPEIDLESFSLETFLP